MSCLYQDTMRAPIWSFLFLCWKTISVYFKHHHIEVLDKENKFSQTKNTLVNRCSFLTFSLVARIIIAPTVATLTTLVVSVIPRQITSVSPHTGPRVCISPRRGNSAVGTRTPTTTTIAPVTTTIRLIPIATIMMLVTMVTMMKCLSRSGPV